MEPFTYVVLGGAISLVSSATVTWLQGRHTRRTADREATRAANRELTRLFIAERDAPREQDDAGLATDRLRSEAELLTSAITERRIRERLRAVVRLLQELHLPELQELAGTRRERARALLCGHALDVLGAHFRGERIPAQPEQVQRLLKVEDEAKRIHHGEVVRAPQPATEQQDAPSEPQAAAGRKDRRRRTKNTGSDSPRAGSGEETEGRDES